MPSLDPATTEKVEVRGFDDADVGLGRPQRRSTGKACIQMERCGGFDELDGVADAMATHEKEDRMVMVSFRIPVAGRLISDSFMWPVDNRDVLQIKLFAVSLLGDVFGAQFATLDPREIECK
jgi:hypothetical protein